MREASESYSAAAREFLEQRVYRGRPARWSVESLTRTVEHVAGLAAGDASDPAWTVVVARLVAAFRHERYKMRRIDDWNAEQERRQRDG